MSTILNALKKIEQDHHRRQVDDAARLSSVSPRRSFRWPSGWRSIPKRWVWVALPLLGLVIGVLISSTLLPWSKKPTKAVQSASVQTQPSPSSMAHIDQTKTVSRDTAQTPTGQATPSTRPIRPIAEARDVAKEREDTASSQSTVVHRPPKTVVSSVPAKSPDSLAKTEKGSPETSQKSKPSPTAKNIQESNTAPAVERSAPFQAPRLTDNRLIVQAIAWSTVVEDRMAVVNNSIVRQGGKVDGFTVEIIGEDQILVKEGQQRYVVPFGSR